MIAMSAAGRQSALGLLPDLVRRLAGYRLAFLPSLFGGVAEAFLYGIAGFSHQLLFGFRHLQGSAEHCPQGDPYAGEHQRLVAEISHEAAAAFDRVEAECRSRAADAARTVGGHIVSFACALVERRCRVADRGGRAAPCCARLAR